MFVLILILILICITFNTVLTAVTFLFVLGCLRYRATVYAWLFLVPFAFVHGKDDFKDFVGVNINQEKAIINFGTLDLLSIYDFCAKLGHQSVCL